MPTPVITARNLVKKYQDFAAVNDVDFEIAPGESFGFLDPNAAGKSTIMRMIDAVSTRTGGTHSVLGLDPNEYGPNWLGRDLTWAQWLAIPSDDQS